MDSPEVYDVSDLFARINVTLFKFELLLLLILLLFFVLNCRRAFKRDGMLTMCSMTALKTSNFYKKILARLCIVFAAAVFF